MLRRSCFALMLALVAAGCSKDSTTSPSGNSSVRYTAVLSPANEVPAIVAPNVDATGSGVATVTLNVTKDSSGAITAATADFSVTLSGFPGGTTLTGAHIHPGAAGTTGGVVWNSTIVNGDIVLAANGSGSFTRTNLNATDAATLAQAIINNPAGYYFNVHTTVNGGGAARGQLVRSN